MKVEYDVSVPGIPREFHQIPSLGNYTSTNAESLLSYIVHVCILDYSFVLLSTA